MVGQQRSTKHYVALGVRTDFENLLTKFTETRSVRYECFSRVWIEEDMSTLFSGRQEERESKEFLTECLRIALKFWLPPFSFQVRVGALYLLYALYFKQPFREDITKIRVTLSHWMLIEQFIQEAKTQRHLDVEFIFRQLQSHRAFHFVATETDLYPYKDNLEHETTAAEEKVQQVEKLKDQKSILSELFEPEVIDQLSAVHDHYHRLKCSLAGPSAQKPEGSLDVIQNVLVQYITKQVASYEEWRKSGGKRPSKRRSREDGMTTSESEADSDYELPSPSRPSVSSSKRSNRVRAIKEKAFNIVATPSRGRRHRQGCKEETSTTEDSSPTKTPARQRRKTPGKDTPAQSKRAVQTSASESSPAPSSTKTSKTKDVFVRDLQPTEPRLDLGQVIRKTLSSMPTMEDLNLPQPSGNSTSRKRKQQSPQKTMLTATKPKKVKETPAKPKTSAPSSKRGRGQARGRGRGGPASRGRGRPRKTNT